MRHDFTLGEIDGRFRKLEAALAARPLPTEAGGTRQAFADEFMLMSEDIGANYARTHFKHRNTRNYITLNWGGSFDFLEVPQTDKPFMRGFFDVFEFVAAE